jgi:hypothetical protein
MKKLVRRFSIITGLMIVAMVQQGFTPPLPPGTTVCLTGIGDFYAARVYTSGPTRPYYYIETCIVDQTYPRSTEWFLTDQQYTDLNNPYVGIQVWTKATSNSSWVYQGIITTESGYVTKTSAGDYLYYIALDMGHLVIPPPCPE